MGKKLRLALLRGLEQSSLTRPFLQVLLRVWPFFLAIRDARKSAVVTLKELEARKLLQGKREVLVRYDNRYCFPGMGDLFIVIMLANYLCDIGFRVTFSYLLSGGNRHDLSKERKEYEKQQLIFNFLHREISTKNSKSVTNAELTHSVFRARIREQRDTTGPSLYLLSLIYLSKNLNPNRLRPLIARDIGVRPSTAIEKGLVKRIGFHVRGSNANVFRNPELSTTLNDFLALTEEFPSAEVIWFGERAKFDEFLEMLAEGQMLTSPPIFQKSGSFPEAISEALSMDFWYQRFGGGIGAISLFTTLPYLILSGDVPATRLYKYRRRQIVPWAERTQRYILLNLTRGRLKGWLRKYRRISKVNEKNYI